MGDMLTRILRGAETSLDTSDAFRFVPRGVSSSSSIGSAIVKASIVRDLAESHAEIQAEVSHHSWAKTPIPTARKIDYLELGFLIRATRIYVREEEVSERRGRLGNLPSDLSGAC